MTEAVRPRVAVERLAECQDRRADLLAQVAVEPERTGGRLSREDWLSPVRLTGGKVVLQVGRARPHHYLTVTRGDNLELFHPRDGGAGHAVSAVGPRWAFRFIHDHHTRPVPVENTPVDHD